MSVLSRCLLPSHPPPQSIIEVEVPNMIEATVRPLIPFDTLRSSPLPSVDKRNCLLPLVNAPTLVLVVSTYF